MSDIGIGTSAAVAWLAECARYFERLPASLEDAEHWSHVANAATARRIAALIETMPANDVPYPAPEPVAVEAGLVERLQDLARHLLAEAQHTSGRKAVTVAYARAEAAAEAASSLPSLQSQVEALTRDRDEARDAFGSLIVATAQAGLGVRDKNAEEVAAGSDDAGKLKIVNRPLEAAEAEVTRLRQRVEEQGKTLETLPTRLDAKGCYEAAQIVRDALFAAGARKEPNNV